MDTNVFEERNFSNSYLHEGFSCVKNYQYFGKILRVKN